MASAFGTTYLPTKCTHHRYSNRTIMLDTQASICSVNINLGVTPQGGRIALKLQYRGTNFHGWAAQNNLRVRTVQGELERALESIGTQHNVPVYAASRTDAGAHARGQVVHFDAFPLFANARYVTWLNYRSVFHSTDALNGAAHGCVL